MDSLRLGERSNYWGELVIIIKIGRGNNLCCIPGMVVTEINLILGIDTSQPIQGISQHYQEIKENPL